MADLFTTFFHLQTGSLQLSQSKATIAFLVTSLTMNLFFSSSVPASTPRLWAPEEISKIKSWKFHKNRESLLHYYVHYLMRRPHHNKMWKKFSKIWLHVHQYQCKPVTFVKLIWAMTLWLSSFRSQNNLLIVNCLISAGIDAKWEFLCQARSYLVNTNQIKSPGWKLSAEISTHLFSAPVD